MAVASLVLGILALVLSLTGIGVIPGIILAIIGVVLGAVGRKNPEKAGLATGGMVCSIIVLVIALVVFFACGGTAACAGCSLLAMS